MITLVTIRVIVVLLRLFALNITTFLTLVILFFVVVTTVSMNEATRVQRFLWIPVLLRRLRWLRRLDI